MNVLVLGGNGFIGSHIVDELYNRGASIKIFDHSPAKVNDHRTDIERLSGEFSDSALLAEALYDVDLVYHLISTTLPSTSNLDPISDIQGNLISTLNLLEKMLQLKVNKIIYLSSGGTVYGNPTEEPVPETHKLNPICSYGIVKVAVENYLFMYKELYNLNATILRPSNPYGPRQSHLGLHGVIPTFLNKISNNEPIQIWGDGTTIRDYIYISDLVDLCVKAGLHNESGIFNAGMGIGYSLNELVEKIQLITGIEAEVEYLPARSFDVKKITLDIQKSEKIFDWTPSISIDKGLRLYWEWLTHAAI